MRDQRHARVFPLRQLVGPPDRCSATNLIDVTERLINTRDGAVIAASVTWARTPVARVRGLMGRPPLRSGEALVIVPATQVHTFGMATAIDVVFCDRNWLVLHVATQLARRRVSRWVRGARFVIELPGASASGVSVGDRLMLEDQSPSVL